MADENIRHEMRNAAAWIASDRSEKHRVVRAHLGLL
jgi:hypothetical protein